MTRRIQFNSLKPISQTQAGAQEFNRALQPGSRAGPYWGRQHRRDSDGRLLDAGGPAGCEPGFEYSGPADVRLGCLGDK